MAKAGRKLRRWNMGVKETVRVELPALPSVGFDEPEWVDLKKVLGRDDERRRKNLSLAQISLSDKQGASKEERELHLEGKLDAFIEAATYAHLAVAIVAWSFDEPINVDTIALLEEPWLDALKEKCEEMHPSEMSEADAKNSEGG